MGVNLPTFGRDDGQVRARIQVLHWKGPPSEFAQFSREHGLKQKDPDIVLGLESALWAVVRSRLFHYAPRPW